MALESLDVERVVSALRAEYKANLEKLAGLPAVGSYSLDGLSVSVGDLRKSLGDRQAVILNELAAFGFPLGTVGVPYQTAERLRG